MRYPCADDGFESRLVGPEERKVLGLPLHTLDSLLIFPRLIWLTEVSRGILQVVLVSLSFTFQL